MGKLPMSDDKFTVNLMYGFCIQNPLRYARAIPPESPKSQIELIQERRDKGDSWLAIGHELIESNMGKIQGVIVTLLIASKVISLITFWSGIYARG